MTATWSTTNKSAAPTWTDAQKSVSEKGGSPIGLLLALTYGQDIPTTWTTINKS